MRGFSGESNADGCGRDLGPAPNGGRVAVSGFCAGRPAVGLAAEGPPQLVAVVDTEEEFDWSSATYDPATSGIGHLRRIGELQALFADHGIRPVYVVDYPVASQPQGVDALAPLAAAGRALIGAHLHPWVSPPFGEALSVANTFPGNLPPAVEAEKLARLTACIAANFGRRPEIYRAGRCGVGPNTFAIAEDQGFTVDLSVAPPFDYSHDGGPDFSRCGLAPRWVGRRGTLLSIPATGALVGLLPSPGLYRRALAPRLRHLRLPGMLSRLRLLDRLRLSPEGYDVASMRRLTEWLLGRGQRIFVLTLHSPSVEPGHTPFVRDGADRRELFARLDGFCRYFFRELGGRAADPLALREAALTAPAAAARRQDGPGEVVSAPAE